MKKLDNFSNCLQVLKRADFVMATQDEIYRTGVIGQFNLTFELAWKAVGEALRLHGVEGAATGSPREILQLAYRHGFINDEAVWLMMLKKRNMVPPSCFANVLPSSADIKAAGIKKKIVAKAM